MLLKLVLILLHSMVFLLFRIHHRREEVVVAETSGPQQPPFQELPLAKKSRVGPAYELGFPLPGESMVDVAWKQVLKCRKRGDDQPDSPVRTVFYSRYPLSRVLNDAAGPRDVEKVATMGVQQTMVAVKSYGHYVSVLTHLAEEALSKTVADHGRLEGDLERTDEELNEYKMERNRLQGDLEKYEHEKTCLDGVVESLTKDNERLSAELEQAKKDWEASQAEVGKCNEMLSGVAAHFPNLPAGSSLAATVDELKESVALSFEDGFNLALAQMRVLNPDIDESQFDVYKVVKNGQIVEEEEEPAVATNETPAGVIHPVIDIASVGAFLLNNEGFEEHGNKGDHTSGGQE